MFQANGSKYIMKHDFVVAILIAALIVGTFTIVIDMMSIPDVHVSYSTNECVKVVNYDNTKYSCENLPEKFNHIWVK